MIPKSLMSINMTPTRIAALRSLLSTRLREYREKKSAIEKIKETKENICDLRRRRTNACWRIDRFQNALHSLDYIENNKNSVSSEYQRYSFESAICMGETGLPYKHPDLGPVPT